MSRRMSRRGLLKAAASGVAGWLILHDSRSAWSYQANERLGIALVGAGKRGSWFVESVARVGANLVAVCDADRERTDEASRKAPGASTFQDFRRMLEELGSRLDGVIVATPDHSHAVISAAAMALGKHVYCEKPIAHDVFEARALRHVASERKVATQMGNQGMASDLFRRTLESIRHGAVGEIREVHVWFVFGGPGPLERPEERPPVPNSLDWDLWIGPAPFRPYHPRYHSGWGAWRDFGTGVLGGGGSHSLNLAFKALELGALWEGGDEKRGPIRVEAEIPERSLESFPRWETLRFDIPARGSLSPARIHWYSAPEPELRRQGIWQRLEKIAGRSLAWETGWTPRSGSLLVGTKGVVHTNAHNSLCATLTGSPAESAGAREPPALVEAHLSEWLRACRGGPSAISSFSHAGPVIELLLLGNVATLVGRPLEFDPVAMRVTNSEEADRALRRPYREGWSL